MTDIQVSRLHYPVTALGTGVRAGIWVQGCTLACSGCLARDTWAARPDRAVPVAAVLDWLAALPQPIDGVTISGGEPLQQPTALHELLTGIARWRGNRPVDVLLYTGYGWAKAARYPGVRSTCDVVIVGRYDERRNTGDTPLRGSTNQRIVPLTPLGRERYSDLGSEALPGPGRLQVSLVDSRLFLIGIPRPGDLDRIRHGLNTRGVDLEDVSWTS
jgi:anaerobic ribonucleoside-triphosphate reductase activating protein